jgi:hypothetical protein
MREKVRNLLVKRLRVEMPVAEEVSDLLCLYALTHPVEDYSETLMISSLSPRLSPDNSGLRVFRTGETLGLCKFLKKLVPCARAAGLFVS